MHSLFLVHEITNLYCLLQSAFKPLTEFYTNKNI